MLSIKLEASEELMTARNISRFLASITLLRDAIVFTDDGSGYRRLKQAWEAKLPGVDAAKIRDLGVELLEFERWPGVEESVSALIAYLSLRTPPHDNDIVIESVEFGSMEFICGKVLEALFRPLEKILGRSNELITAKDAGEERTIKKRMVYDGMERVVRDPEERYGAAGLLVVGTEALTSTYKDMKVEDVRVTELVYA